MKVSEASPGEGWQSPGALADVLGVSLQHFQRHYKPMVLGGDIEKRGRRVWIRGRGLIDVIVEREVSRREAEIASGRRPAADEVGDDALMGGGGKDTPELRRYRLARAKMVELDLAERSGEMIRAERIHGLMARVANVLKRAGDQINKRWPEAGRLLREALGDMRHELQTGLGDEPVEAGTTNAGGAN